MIKVQKEAPRKKEPVAAAARTSNSVKQGLAFKELAPFLSNHNGKCPMQNLRFIDDSPLCMVSFVR